tara:strand:+ start:228 stop:812 length:585 start_codon:yes stop_codon:yes gene_type:complete
MSSNNTATLGGRGLGAVTQAYAVNPLAVRGEQAKSVHHKLITAYTGADLTISVANGTAANQVAAKDLAFLLQNVPVTTTAGSDQIISLATQYPGTNTVPGTGVNNANFKIEVEIFGNGTAGTAAAPASTGTFGMATTGTSFGMIEAHFEDTGGDGLNDIIIARRLNAMQTAGTLTQCSLAVRLVRRIPVFRVPA